MVLKHTRATYPLSHDEVTQVDSRAGAHWVSFYAGQDDEARQVGLFECKHMLCIPYNNVCLLLCFLADDVGDTSVHPRLWSEIGWRCPIKFGWR